MIIWHNGAFHPETASAVGVTDRGLTLGDGVFDTMLAVDGALQAAEAHGQRLKRHAAVIKLFFDLDFTATALALLERNGFTQGRFAIRTTVTRGPGERGLAPPVHPQPTIIMRASHAPEPAKTVRAIISKTVRRNEHSPLSQIKSLNYGDNLLALMEAKDKGADDAILLNGAGHACCASAANIFILEGCRYMTPPLSDGVLDGITRAQFMAEYAAVEQSIDETRLRGADKIIFTSAIAGVREVSLV